MKRNNSFFIVFQYMSFIAICITFFLITIHFFYKKLPPLQLSSIPQETIDFFKKLPGYIDIGFHFNPNPDPSNWGRYEPVDSMLHVEDTLFMVFYSRIDSANEVSKAKMALKLANNAVPELVKLMKNYPYPYQVKKRKLPIYLADNDKSYVEIQKKLSPIGACQSIGVYIFEYSSLGTMTNGIVISPEAFTAFNKNAEESFRITLWHEMNHYAYFTNFDFINNTLPYLWYTEGCAEYFAQNLVRSNEINKSEAINYKYEQNNTNSSAYWVGYTSFIYYEKTYGKNKLSDLISSSYKNSISKALNSTSGITINVWEKGWKEYIKNK